MTLYGLESRIQRAALPTFPSVLVPLARRSSKTRFRPILRHVGDLIRPVKVTEEIASTRALACRLLLSHSLQGSQSIQPLTPSLTSAEQLLA